MSHWYQRMRAEIAAGGAVTERDEATLGGRLTGVAMIVLLAWLAVANTWSFVFVVGLLVSVFLHEVGHWSTARLTGMKATQFFMGFGPRVWSKTRGETEWGVRALPVGAYVRIIGMNNLDEVDPDDEPRAYRSKSYPRRMLVITAGSLMHLVLAFLLFTGVYAVGGREEHSGEAIVREIVLDSPASRAGIEVGDEIVSIGGAEISDYDSMSRAIKAHAPGESVEIVYIRDGAEATVSATLAENESRPGVGWMGIAADDWGWVDYAAPSAAGRAFLDIGVTAVESVKGVVVALNPLNSVRHLVGDDASLETRPTTVVGISQLSGEVGRFDGLKGILVLLASVNVFVGVFNLFPLLPFDGGHAAIATYERIRSRKGRPYRADITKMVPVATAVVALLVVLMVTGLWLDITSPLG